MARDHLVARDFLGLGRDAANDLRMVETYLEGNHVPLLPNSRLLGPFCVQFQEGEASLARLQQMSEQNGFQLASAFSANGGAFAKGANAAVANILPTSMGTRPGKGPIQSLINGGYKAAGNLLPEEQMHFMKNGGTLSRGQKTLRTGYEEEQKRDDSGRLATACDKDRVGKALEELTDADIQQLTREECRQYLKEKGMRWPSWNKAAAVQQVIALKNLRSEEISSIQNMGNPHIQLSQAREALNMWNAANHLQSNSSEQNSPRILGASGNISHSVQHGHSVLSSGQHGSQDKSRAMPDANLSLSIGASGESHLSSSIEATSESVSNSNVLPSAQMTIFYAGNVNVYDNVAKDKAQAIMLLAGRLAAGGNSWASNPANAAYLRSLLVAAGAINASANSSAAELQQVQPQSSQQAPQSPSTAIAPMQGVVAPAQVCHAVSHKALPQARKASLARFLEKRKERCVSKSPYPLRNSAAGSSPSNKIDASEISEPCSSASVARDSPFIEEESKPAMPGAGSVTNVVTEMSNQRAGIVL